MGRKNFCTEVQVSSCLGYANFVVDTLSIKYESPTSDLVEQVESYLVLTDFPLAFQELTQLQREEFALAGIVTQLEKGDTVGGYTLSKGILYCRCTKRGDPKLAVPTAAIPMVFAYFHSSQPVRYLGFFKTISKISSKFIWKGMEKDIGSRVRACHTCALSKPAQNSRWGWLASDVAQRPFHKILIDNVGKVPRSKAGNTAILFCVDAFSMFVWMVPVREATTRTTIKALHENIFGSFLYRKC